MASSFERPGAANHGVSSELRSETTPSGTLLIVDDEPTVIRALARILRDTGPRIEGATSVAAACTALEDPALEVVLLDLMLGADDGALLLDRIKRERPDIEVVVMTGRATVDSAVGCMRRGAFDYLAKPFLDLSRVTATVRTAFERHRRRARPRAAAVGSTAPSEPLPLSLDAYEKRALERALDETAGDAGLAARRLGIGRSTLYRKLAKHGLRARRAGAVDGAGGRGAIG